MGWVSNSEAGSGETYIPYATLFCNFRQVTAPCFEPQFPQLLKKSNNTGHLGEALSSSSVLVLQQCPKASVQLKPPSDLEAFLVHDRAYRNSCKGFTATVAVFVKPLYHLTVSRSPNYIPLCSCARSFANTTKGSSAR